MRIEKELQSHDLNEQLRFVEQRIKMHLKNRELDAALILSKDMIGLAEGDRTHVTDLELLPRTQFAKTFTKKETVAGMCITALACSFCLVLAFHYAILSSAYNWLYDKNLYSQARIAAQCEVFIASSLRQQCGDSTVAIADTYANEGDLSTARRLLSSELTHHPTNGNAYILSAYIEWSCGNLEQAERAFKHAVEYRTANWNSLVCNLAGVQLAEGKSADANCTIGLVNVGEPLTDFQKAKIQLIRGDFHGSCESFRQALKDCKTEDNLFDQHQLFRHLEFYSKALRMDGQNDKTGTIEAQARVLREKLAIH